MIKRSITSTEKAYTQFLALVRIGRYHKKMEISQSKTVLQIANKKGFIELINTTSEIVQDMIDKPLSWREEYPEAHENVIIMELGYDPFN